MKSPTIKLETLTPEDAAVLLATQRSNRALRDSWVRELRAEMRGGHWQAVPSRCLTVDRDGRLADGQHRLSAQIAEGVTLDYYVMRGADPLCMMLPEGLTRRPCDYLVQRRGVINSNKSSAILAAAYRYGHANENTGKVRPDTHVAWWDILGYAVEFVISAVGGNIVKPVSSPVLAVGVRAIHGGEDDSLVSQFMVVMRTGLPDCASNDPTAPLSLARQIMNLDGRMSNGSAFARSLTLTTETAMRAYLDNRRLTVIRPTATRHWMLTETPGR